MPEKRLTLNSEKRKAIADVFQNHFEQNSPKYELHIQKQLLITILLELK